jgi:hypothetical protein
LDITGGHSKLHPAEFQKYYTSAKNARMNTDMSVKSGKCRQKINE